MLHAQNICSISTNFGFFFLAHRNDRLTSNDDVVSEAMLPKLEWNKSFQRNRFFSKAVFCNRVSFYEKKNRFVLQKECSEGLIKRLVFNERLLSLSSASKNDFRLFLVSQDAL